ncbi:MAG: tetratricopeptide repeat protein [Promethearchaeota archaeon]
MIKKRSSLLKKIEALMKEANEFKTRGDLDSAILKFEEAKDLVSSDFKDEELINEQLDKIENAIINILLDKINSMILKAKELMEDRKSADAKKLLEEALNVSEKIGNLEIRGNLADHVKSLIIINEFNNIIKSIASYMEQDNIEEAMCELEKAQKIVVKTSSSIIKSKTEEQIQKITEQVYRSLVDQCLIEVNALIGQEELEKALTMLHDKLNSLKKSLFLEKLEPLSLKLKEKINEIHAIKIKPLIREGESLLKQGNLENSIPFFMQAREIIEIMEETEQKIQHVEKLSLILDPYLKEKITSLLEQGTALIQEENFEQSTKLITDAMSIFKKALTIAESLVNSKQREQEIAQIREMLEKTCTKGINTRKETARYLTEEKKYDEAIGAIYSALSIAKNLACAEEENEPIQDLKRFINETYSIQIHELMDKVKIKANEGTFEEAKKILKDALGITNKMYLSKEMDEEINNINKLMKHVELKETIAKGEDLLIEKEFSEQNEELKKKLANAEKITDPELKAQELMEIKNLIDDIHASKIYMLLEHFNRDFKNGLHEKALEHVDRAISISQTFEFNENKEKVLSDVFKSQMELFKAILDANQTKYLSMLLEKSHEIIKEMEKEKNIDSCLEQLVNSILLLSQKFHNAKKWEEIFSLLKKAVLFCDVSKNEKLKEDLILKIKNKLKKYLILSIQELMRKEDYEKIIEQTSELIKIDENLPDAYYYLASAYLFKNLLNKAIENFEIVIKLESKHLNALTSLGLIYELQGNAGDAQKFYERAIAVDFLEFLKINRQLFYKLQNKQ